MTPDEFARRKDYPCPVCGYYGVGCICNEVHYAETPLEIKEDELIVLLPDHAPLTRDEQIDAFHNEPNYDNLAIDDRHFLISAIRLFWEGRGDEANLDTLNLHLEISSLNRELHRLSDSVDSHEN